MNTPGSPQRTVQRLNQAIVDLTGDEYFGSHPFFIGFANGPGVVVLDPIRLAEVLEGVARDRVQPQPSENPAQLKFDL